MKKVTQPKYVMVCDVCLLDDSQVSFRSAGEIHIKQHALDNQGSPCACGDRKFDVCDKCMPKLVTAINIRAHTIRISGE